MSGIDLAALLTTLLALAAVGTIVWQVSDPADRRWLTCLCVFGLPLSPLAFYVIRLPLDRVLTNWIGKDSLLLIVCQLCYAPCTEEPAKLLPLLFVWPFFKQRLQPRNLVPAALALGLGFAIGEMWLVAHFVRSKPELATLPFYQFGGFLNERLMTCVTHAGFTVLALWGLQRGGLRIILGMLAAMLAHFLGNFPIFLMSIDCGGWGSDVWGAIVFAWVLGFVVASFVLLTVMHGGVKLLRRVLKAKMKCPECGATYSQPWLGGNFGMWRYEPCGACHKWHWISLRDLPSESE